MTEKLNSFAFGAFAVIVAALSMLILGILENIGVYKGAVEMMTQWHMFFSLTPFGILTGMIEAAVISFLFSIFSRGSTINSCSGLFICVFENN